MPGMPGNPGDLVTLQTSVYKGSREGKFQYTTVVRFKYQNPCKSAVQTVRPQVCSSNSETPGLKLKYWEPRSAAQILRAQVYISWAVDLGSRYLNFRPWVSVFELQTRGLTVWIADLGSQYLIADLRSQYLICRPDLQVQIILASNGCQIYTLSLVSFQ